MQPHVWPLHQGHLTSYEAFFTCLFFQVTGKNYFIGEQQILGHNTISG